MRERAAAAARNLNAREVAREKQEESWRCKM